MSYVITIAREYASGGRLIAQKLSEALNIPYYDKEMITDASKKSGFSEYMIEQAEQKRTNSLLYSLYASTGELPIGDQVYLVQSQIIRDYAKEGNCIIVGRCADHVLKDNENCIRIFIHAPIQERVKRARDEYGIEVPNIEKYVISQDKRRAAYYNFYSDVKWGRSQNYHLSIDSSIGIDTAVELIKKLVEEKK